MPAFWVGLGIAAIGGALQYQNTQQTAHRQDQQAALSIQHQSGIQKEADAKVNDEVTKLSQSTAASERASRLNDYIGVLRTAKAKTDQNPAFGSTALQQGAVNANAAGNADATQNANLMASMDAPNLQRMQESFGYGQLGTDLNTIGRQSSGQAYIDQLRQNAIRRSAGKDLAAGLMMSAGSGMASGGGGTGGTAANTRDEAATAGQFGQPMQYTPYKNGWSGQYGGKF